SGFLGSAPALDVAIPVPEGDGAHDAVCSLFEAAGASEGAAQFTAVIAGRLHPEMRDRAPAGIHVAPPVTNLRPLLAASQILFLPAFDAPGGEALFGHFVMAVGHGRPVLAGSGIAAALQRRGLPADVAAAVIVDRVEDIWPTLRAAVERPERRAEIAAASARIGEALRAAGVIGEAWAAGPSSQLWDSEIKEINDTVRLCMAGRRDARAAAARLGARFRSEEGYSAKVTAILRALFVDKDAACLAVDRPAWRRIRQFRPVASPATALALLYAAAEWPDVLERSGEFFPHGLAGFTVTRAGTALDAWRRGTALASPPRAELRPPHIVVLLDGAAADGLDPARLMADALAAAVRRTGATVAANAALALPDAEEVELLATPTAIRRALDRADLVIGLGGPQSRFSPDAFRLATMALRCGRPLLGNSAMFWHFDGAASPFVCDDPMALDARIEDALSCYVPAAAASAALQHRSSARPSSLSHS
ncbi:MAG TPA: hypothetical protein VE993_08100, partial [Stellaceae bacterium]|nr:hypothetical protein [Stellaceae bacterium]